MARRLAAGLAITSLIAGATAIISLPAQADEPVEPSGLQLDLSIGTAGRVNLAGPGLVPVTVAGTAAISADDIDPETITLGEAAGAAVGPARGADATVIASTVDVDNDGRDDLVVHFDKETLESDAGLGPDTVELTLEASRQDGVTVSGSGGVRPEVVLEIKFDESLEVRGADATVHSERGRSLARVDAALDRFGGADELTPFVDEATAERLAEVAAEAAARTGEPVPDLASWYNLTLPADANVEDALAELKALPEIEHVYPAPEPVPPPQEPDTPDFTGLQRYFRGAGENGIDAAFSRADPRIRGAGIKIVDLEYDWNETHEDLQLTHETDLGGTAFIRYPLFMDEHGTAVLGIMGALDNGYGITGGVPDATLYGISPTRRTASGGFGAWAPGPALAYLASIQDESGDPFLQPGDAVLLEQQTNSPSSVPGSFAPLEWIPAVFEADVLLNAMGVTVVSTGGNGNTDSDHPGYTRDGIMWFDPDPDGHHSGAIFVGAGNSNTRERLNFSNYGSRFDLQGWGSGIPTTGGNGNLFNMGVDRRYTSSFGGTSGAGPIVTSAVVAIQSYLKATGQAPWSARQIADLLEATGQAQGPNTAAQHIGPLPNLRAALISIEVDAPETTLAVDGRAARAGSYISPLITLEADDGWGSGVERTEYRLGDGDWTNYQSPLELAEPGVHALSYRSVDHNGNVEETATADIEVADCALTITGAHDSPLRVTSGVTCLTEDAAVTGAITVTSGGGLLVTDASIVGRVLATGASTVQVYDSTVDGPVQISGTTGRLAVAGSMVIGQVVVTDNTTGDTPALISANTIDGRLACSGNDPAPVNDGLANAVTGPKSGQCAAL